MTNQLELDADAADLLDELDRAGVDYRIVGAHALAAHGIVRATADLDLLIRCDAANAQKTYEALVRFGAPVQAHGFTPDYLATEGRVYQMGLPPRRIDLLSSISGVTTQDAFADPKEVQAGGRNRRALGLKALLQNKRATGRPKDALDVEALEKLK